MCILINLLNVTKLNFIKFINISPAYNVVNKCLNLCTLEAISIKEERL